MNRKEGASANVLLFLLKCLLLSYIVTGGLLMLLALLLYKLQLTEQVVSIAIILIDVYKRQD